MKLHELLRLNEEMEHTIQGNVTSLSQLKDVNGKYFTGIVNVTGDVSLSQLSLKQLPVKFGTIGEYFSCALNHLTSLEGAPSSVGGFFTCSLNKLSSLQGVHKIIKKIDGQMFIGRNPIKTGGIGLILIEGLTEINSELPAFKIINKYIGKGKKGLLLCQEELDEAGLEEYAKL